MLNIQNVTAFKIGTQWNLYGFYIDLWFELILFLKMYDMIILNRYFLYWTFIVVKMNCSTFYAGSASVLMLIK